MTDKYILDENGDPCECEDLLKWGQWLEAADRKVAKTQVTEDIEVSTVFLGLDHSFSLGPPLLYETMIFGGEHDGHMDRYSTKEDALRGHENVVAMCS